MVSCETAFSHLLGTPSVTYTRRQRPGQVGLDHATASRRLGGVSAESEGVSREAIAGRPPTSHTTPHVIEQLRHDAIRDDLAARLTAYAVLLDEGDARLPWCEACGTTLTGSRKQWWSEACRQQAKHARSDVARSHDKENTRSIATRDEVAANASAKSCDGTSQRRRSAPPRGDRARRMRQL